MSPIFVSNSLSIYLSTLSSIQKKIHRRNFQVLEKKNYLEQRVRLCPSLIYFYSPVMNRIPVMYSLPEIFEMVFSKVVHDKDYLYIKKENDNCQLLPFCFKYFHILPIFLLLFASSDKYPLQNYQKWRQVIIYLSTGLVATHKRWDCEDDRKLLKCYDYKLN